ncbi:MAG TPA: zf-HC2 domain-containing protein [Gemmatimonadaceae bacterium]|nr:zf-HC2 domain-containing protein [Gemmatimonadaceae bacterium]
MNECTEIEINEMLPDLLHQSLAPDAAVRVEAHLAACTVCREDLEILRTVMGAAVFAPTISVDRVARQIPPYQRILPAETPVVTRAVKWLAAAAVVLLVVGSGSVLIVRQNSASSPTVVASGSQAQVATQNPAAIATPSTVAQTRSATSRTTTGTHALALAADVDGLSDGNLAQLMNEMTSFDALPASEPEPVISVDSGYNLEQDLR